MSQLSRCLCPLAQDLNGKLEKAFRKKRVPLQWKKKKKKIPDYKYSAWFDSERLLYYYCYSNQETFMLCKAHAYKTPVPKTLLCNIQTRQQK